MATEEKAIEVEVEEEEEEEEEEDDDDGDEDEGFMAERMVSNAPHGGGDSAKARRPMVCLCQRITKHGYGVC
jgi:hypothetical protein